MRFAICTGLVLAAVAALASPAQALDDERWAKANAAIEKGIAYLRSTQGEDGSWTSRVGPAVTGLIVAPMLDRPNIDADDPTVRKALDYILAHAQEDGGIYNRILGNYNTSISISALTRVNNDPKVAAVLKRAQDYLRGLQWTDGKVDPKGKKIDEDHPFYGGLGYGGSGRPDMSNTHFAIQALHDLGVDCENDPTFLKAMEFISRCQGVPSNKMHGDKIVQDGGFIYATSINKDLIGVPESKASPKLMDEAKLGKPISGLRTYGSITYAGFMSFAYANFDRDDPRVTAAIDWISKNYTLDQNPGMPEDIKLQGLFYYYMTFAKALDAWGTTYVTTADGKKHDWANDLVDRLAAMQREDGSWVNDADRWMEGDPNLVTAYALIALTHATR